MTGLFLEGPPTTDRASPFRKKEKKSVGLQDEFTKCFELKKEAQPCD